MEGGLARPRPNVAGKQILFSSPALPYSQIVSKPLTLFPFISLSLSLSLSLSFSLSLSLSLSLSEGTAQCSGFPAHLRTID